MAQSIYRARAFSGLWTQRNPLREGRPDALLDGLNVELTNRMTLARAPGSTPYSTQTIPHADSFYSFRKFSGETETITLMVDTASAIYALTPTARTTALTKAVGAGKAYFHGVANTLYIGDGVEQKAYQNDASRNWGISSGTVSGASFIDTAYAGTAADQGSGVGSDSGGPNLASLAQNGGGGGTNWLGLANIAAEDGAQVETTNLVEGSTSEYLQVYSFNFAIPSTATITGILAEVKADSSVLGSTGIVDSEVLLIVDGGFAGSNRSVGYDLSGGGNWFSFGGSSDMWGTTLTYTQANTNTTAGFGLAFRVQNTHSASVGDYDATAFVDAVRITIYYTLPATYSWTTPNNALGAPDASYATATSPTTNLKLTNYSLSVAAGNLITGVSVNIRGKHSSVGGFIKVTLLYGGSSTGITQTVPFESGADTTVTVGGPSDLFGFAWTPTNANASTFGVQIAGIFTDTPGTLSINSAEISVHSIGSVAVAVSGSAGTMSATVGYKYGFAYGNSVSGAISNMSPPSPSTGIFTNKLNVGVGVVASTDPQVNQIWVFRTTDGGSTYYSIPSNPYPNTTATITDSATDATLNILQQASVNLENTPPPTGLKAMAYHMDRMWGIVGNTVYYSAGPDLGNIMGNGNESWPPANTFPFPSAGTRLVPMSAGLLVITVSDFYIIRGNGSAVAATAIAGITPFYSSPFIKGIGLLHYHALDLNGTVIYMHAADGQLLSLEPSSGVSEIGFPIGSVPSGFALNSIDTLDDFDPATSFVSWHVAGSADKALYVSDGSTGWFRLDTSRAPDGWSPKRELTGGCSAVQSIETSPGVRKLLIGPATIGDVLYRDLSVFADNEEEYPAYMRLGSIVLTQPGQLARLAFLAADFAAVGTQPSVSVSLDELNAQVFDDITVNREVESPVLYAQGPGPGTIYSNRYNITTDLNRPAWCRHLQVTISFGTDTVQNELLGLSIFGAGYQTQ